MGKTLNIHEILAKLAQERPLFHSEADFQHALAWQLHMDHPEARIRLEHPRDGETRVFIDIVCGIGAHTYWLELKYKTAILKHRESEEKFALKHQGAQNLARYDFLNDIARLENLVLDDSHHGFAILLTNDQLLWNAPESYTNDAAFRLHENSVIKGTRPWSANTGGTMKGREEPIVLRGRYRNLWRDYSQPAEGAGGAFRYLAHTITAPSL